MTNHTIIKANFQTSNRTVVALECTICEKPLISGQASAGPYNAYGELTLICTGHRQNFRQFLNLFADFRAVERQKFLQRDATIEEITPDAWFLH